ncbi:MAG TPA: tRNA uridine-5-carboxymethylaminomethyl(34) synthesis GTPase MnmE [Clostridiales bacterium]|nr:tRNA uridine-5-carboxymethylaminomethyl(34) synthesis GTPase MnmE [Clostridiales bacterium]
MFETIVALATPPLRSALAIVRLSGNDCFNVVSNFYSKNLIGLTQNSLLHGYIKDGDNFVDEVVLLLYKGPKSFTGEDSVEIICHGSPLIFNKIINLAIKYGARMAERGEYSSRAFLNGKLDLIQAESINDLINAETEESKNVSLLALKGDTSKLIFPIKKEIGDMLSTIEANIDYSEYTDIEEMNSKEIIEFCNDISRKINILIANGRKGKLIKYGINVVIVGRPNVGKSSIFNSLLKEDKAIVSNIKGTTRDIVEGKINLNGILINLYDTAGIRDSNDYIESLGINKSKKILEIADIVIVVFDNEKLNDEDLSILNIVKNKNIIEVYNKSDLNNYKKGILTTNALKHNVNLLHDEILKKLNLKDDDYKTPSLANTREIGLLESCLEEINLTKKLALNGETIDILSEHIKTSYLKILAITGENYDFDMAKEIFSRFCLGK